MEPGNSHSNAPQTQPGYLHDRVADFVRGLIRDGTLQPGERVPSLRRIRQRLQVSMATATRAYQALEDAGWIQARPQAGFYVRAAPDTALAAPQRGEPSGRPERVDVASVLRSLVPAPGDAERMVTLSLADPDPELLPVKALQRSLARVSRNQPAEAIGYAFAPGHEGLRRQIAYRLADAGCRVHPDEILVTTGCSEALALALQCVARPGAVIAVESPTFFNILSLIESLGMRALELPTDPRTGLDPDALEQRVQYGQVDAALVIPNFSNPLGSCMPRAAKQRLAALSDRYGVPVIEDDIYGDLGFADQRPPLVRAFAAQGRVLSAASFSKTIAPGYRVGWLLAGVWGERAASLKHALSVATASLPQLTIADLLSTGGYDRHLKRVRRHYREQVERMRHAIARYFPTGTRVTDPEGGFLLWVELPAGVDATDVYHRALALGVRVAPGGLFSTGPAYDGYLRLSCGAPWAPAIEQAIRTLGGIVAEFTPVTAELSARPTKA
jgi:DNA-binding transcriptional MocR family regulator